MFFQIANHLETDLCNEYRYCRLPGMAVSKCAVTPDPAAPFHFDRNTGTCVDNTGFVRLPSCDPKSGGNVDPCKVAAATFVGYVGLGSADITPNTITECDKWYFCYESATYDSGKCDCGQEFDSASNPCKMSANPLARCPTSTNLVLVCPVKTFKSFLTSKDLKRENRNLFL